MSFYAVLYPFTPSVSLFFFCPHRFVDAMRVEGRRRFSLIRVGDRRVPEGTGANQEEGKDEREHPEG